jgi:light-regulated signal transduction histidine kinase (bacteriophytochrome)
LNNDKKEYIEFIESAIHDLDAPLRKLSFFSEKLSQKLKNVSQDGVQEYLSRMQSCVSDMRMTIEGLSVLTQVTTDSTEMIACNLENIAKEAWKDLQQYAEEKKAIINFNPLPVIEGDPNQLRQLFKNLFENAVKFGKNGIPVTIDVRSGIANAEEKEQLGLEGSYYEIEISDNGIGFRKEYAEKIFKPFVRLHGRSEFPGNGLGLAICKKIMENHRGVIYANCIENSGACFVLILPKKN